MKNTQEQREEEYFIYTENDLDYEYACYLFEKDYDIQLPPLSWLRKYAPW